MAHLKHAGPIRRASAAKRTALVEILSDDVAANEGDLTEADLLEIDRQYAAAKSDGSITRWRDERALADQMQRHGATS